jgi:Tfp pilus assembly protein PilF
MNRFIAAGALASLLAFATPATAATTVVPPPDAVYADDDPAAIAIRAQPGGRADLRRRLDAAIRARPDDVLALTHRANFHYAGGHGAEGQRDYERAFALTAPGGEAQRHVLWSWGWALFNAGDADQALQKWRASAVQAAPARPFWVPYTYALAHWKLGQPDMAVAWFDAAVRSNPSWGTAEGRAARTAKWRHAEKAMLVEVAAAWEARRANVAVVTHP